MRGADAERRASGRWPLAAALVLATPARAWKSLVDVGAWWDPEHTYSGSTRSLRIDARPGGCFCERLKGQGGVEHARVVQVAPAVDQVLTWQLERLRSYVDTGRPGAPR